MMPKGRINARIFHLTQKWQAICWRGAKAQPFLITFVFELWKYLFHLFCAAIAAALIFGGSAPQIQRRLRNAHLVHGGGNEFAAANIMGLRQFLRGIFKHDVIAAQPQAGPSRPSFSIRGRDQIPLDTTARSQ